jgi:hypothetical protein
MKLDELRKRFRSVPANDAPSETVGDRLDAMRARLDKAAAEAQDRIARLHAGESATQECRECAEYFDYTMHDFVVVESELGPMFVPPELCEACRPCIACATCGKALDRSSVRYGVCDDCVARKVAP